MKENKNIKTCREYSLGNVVSIIFIILITSFFGIFLLFSNKTFNNNSFKNNKIEVIINNKYICKLFNSKNDKQTCQIKGYLLSDNSNFFQIGILKNNLLKIQNINKKNVKAILYIHQLKNKNKSKNK